MHVTDWFPTLLSSAGLTPSSDELDGVDQWDALLDDTISSPRQEMIYNIVKDGGKTSTCFEPSYSMGAKKRHLNVLNVSMYWLVELFQRIDY